MYQEKCQSVTSSPGLLNLIQLGTQQHNIPASAKRGILKALVMVASAHCDINFRNEYWNQVGETKITSSLATRV